MATSDTPVLLNLLPAGKSVMVDLYEKAGGLPPLARYMIDQGLLDSEAKTITGKTIGADLADVRSPDFQDPDTDVIRSIESPLKPKSSLVIVKGDFSTDATASIATRGCVFKVNANQRVLEGPARVFDIENDAHCLPNRTSLRRRRSLVAARLRDGELVLKLPLCLALF